MLTADPALPVPHQGKNKNLQIQWLRTIAALSVMLFHASAFAQEYLHNDRFIHIFTGQFGLFGVSLFFAISGYLMAVAIQVQKPFLFLSHRAIRIFPLLWMIYVGYYGAGFLMGKHAIPDIRSFLLVPYGQLGGPFGVEWSLTFEFVFYLAIFAVGLLGWAGRLPWIAAAWLAVLAIATYLRFDAQPAEILIGRILVDPASAPFAMGLLIPLALQRKGPPLLIFASGVIVCGLQIFVDNSLDLSRWTYALGTMLILTGAVGAAQQTPSLGDTRTGTAFARAGDYSYALYLCHVPILWFLFRERPPHLPSAELWGLAVAIVLIAAATLGEIELALYRRLKRAVNAADPRWIAVAMTLFVAVFLLISLDPSLHLPPHTP